MRLLIRRSARANVLRNAFFCAVYLLGASVPARADVALAVGGALAIGHHSSVDGTVRGGGAFVPLIDVDAEGGTLAIHAESVPFVETRSYGNRSAPSISSIESAQASLRTFLPGHKIALGLGYGTLFTTVDRTAPSGSLTLQAGGLRLEALERFVLSPHARIEVTVGAIPRGTGSLITRVGVDRAASLSDPLTGMQLDATVREVAWNRGRLSVTYGVRYLDQRYSFATSHALVERNVAILPFAEARIRL